MLCQFAYIEFETECIAKEARERVHSDHIENVISVTSALDHFLELGSSIIGRGCARFDIFGRDKPTTLRDPRVRLGSLVRDRQVMFGLPASGDTQVNSNTLRGRPTIIALRACRRRSEIWLGH